MVMGMTWLANTEFDTAWAHAPWTDFRDGRTSETMAILPIHGFADHGLGLALDVEETVGNEILHRAVLEAKPVVPIRVLPPLRFGPAPYAASFFGVDPETAHDLLREIATGVKAAGGAKLVFLVTSPWQIEFVDAASRDVRVEVGLQTFVIPLAGLGLSLHPDSADRSIVQALGSHLLAQTPGPARPGIAVEPDFRPGRWDQPAPVVPAPALDVPAVLGRAQLHLARLLTEIAGRAPLGQRDHRPPPPLPAQPSPRRAGTPTLWPSYRSRYLPSLTRDELEALPDKDRAFVIIPTGSVEQHGPHLPVGVDAILGQAWLEAALPLLPPTLPIWVAPPLTYGKSNEHVGFPGTLSVSGRSLRRLLMALASQLKALGFRQLGILNTHGGNSAVLVYTLREIQTQLGLRAGMIGQPYRPELSPQEAQYGFHAGEWETGLMMAAAGDLVRPECAVCEWPVREDDSGELRPENAPAIFSWITSDISRSGVMGDATAATPEKGRLWLTEGARALAARIADLTARGKA